jgi:predicted nucleic acid-binding protein
MILADLPLGDSVLIDANTWVYHFAPHPKFGVTCTDLIRKIELQTITGFTSTHIVTEMAHRLMLMEASDLEGWPLAGTLKRLQKDSRVVQKLIKFRTAIEELLKTGVKVLTVRDDHILAAATISQQTGLLSNDALIVALMQANGITKLASHDTDFDRVPGITRYGPA